MAKQLAGLAACMLMALMTACVPSIHSLYTEDTLTFEPRLLGTWVDTEGDDIWIFEPSGAEMYKVTLFEDGDEAKAGVFEAHLARVGSYLYLDFYPQVPETGNEFYKFHLRPVHSFARISLDGDTLGLASLEPDWLQKKIKKKAGVLPHIMVGDDLVLTAGSEALQVFLIATEDEEGAFAKPGMLRRRN